MRRVAVLTAAGACLLCGQPGFAQLPVARAGDASASLSVSAGFSWNDRRDLSASPLLFGGHGGDFGLAAQRTLGHASLQFSLHGGARTLASSSNSAPATEHLTELQAHIWLMRRLHLQPIATDGLLIGLALESSAALSAHDYTDPARRVSHFVLGIVTLGPAASWRQTVHGGLATLEIATPVTAAVAHSYSAVNQQNSAVNLRVVSLGALRGVTSSLSYAPWKSQRVGVLYLYRLSALRYDDVQDVRLVSQSLSVGAVVRFGGAAP